MSSASGPVRWGWPMNSSRLWGRRRSASGAAADSLGGPLLRLDGSAWAKAALGRFLDEVATRSGAEAGAEEAAVGAGARWADGLFKLKMGATGGRGVFGSEAAAAAAKEVTVQA